MKDHLKELCKNLNIELIYTDDDCTALSSDIMGTKATIRVDKVFMGCAEKVAKAIVGYYTEPGHEDEYLKVIRHHILENIVTVEYTIVPPDETFKGMFIKYIDGEEVPEVKTSKSKAAGSKTARSRAAGSKTSKSKASSTGAAKDDISSLIEANISSIIRKDFYGGIKRITAGETIKPSSDDVIELDIEVDNSTQ